MTLEDALAALSKTADADKAKEMARYHKVARPYLGVANPAIDACAKDWRQTLTLEKRLSLADDLWQSNIHEARVAAAKVLTQARIKPEDQAAWELIKSWVPDFDAWAVADHAAIAGQKRLSADPARLDDIERWTTSDHLWTKRAALVMTLPWCKNRNPKQSELVQRERILTWAAEYTLDQEWFIQKAVAWWLRDLSKRDPERVKTFLVQFGPNMKNFARKEAARYL